MSILEEWLHISNVLNISRNGTTIHLVLSAGQKGSSL